MLKLSEAKQKELEMLLKITLHYLIRKYIKKDLDLSSKTIFKLKKETEVMWSKGMTFSLFVFYCIPFVFREDFILSLGLTIDNRKELQSIAIKTMNSIITDEKKLNGFI